MKRKERLESREVVGEKEAVKDRHWRQRYRPSDSFNNDCFYLGSLNFWLINVALLSCSGPIKLTDVPEWPNGCVLRPDNVCT